MQDARDRQPPLRPANLPAVAAALAVFAASLAASPTPAFAQTGTRLVFITSAVAVTAGEVSDTHTVQQQDANGNPVAAVSNLPIKLTSNSSGAVTFYETNGTTAIPGGCTRIASGVSTVSFKYRDTRSGTPTVTAADNTAAGCTGPDGSLTNAAQEISVRNKLAFVTSPQTIAVRALSSTMTLQLRDGTGAAVSPTSDLSVSLFSTSTTGYFCASSAASPCTEGTDDIATVTIPAEGTSASFRYVDPRTGMFTLTAIANGVATATQQTTVASKLAFTTGPQTIAAGALSDIATVQLQGQFDNPLNAPSNFAVYLCSSSTTGTFYDPTGGARSGSPPSVNLPSGQSSVSFRYRDDTVGAPSIGARDESTCAAPDSNLANASQIGSIIAAPTPSPTPTSPTPATPPPPTGTPLATAVPTLPPPPPPPATYPEPFPPLPLVTVGGNQFVGPLGEPMFVLGANYEGPADRAWQMWEDERFAPALIAADMARARAASVSVLRLFIQRPLAEDILAGRWAKLDQVVDLAHQQGIKVVLTFADYFESRPADLAAIDRVVARRYRDRTTIFGYDLKNEPRFGDLALAEYPPGFLVPLQDPGLVPRVDETISRAGIAAYRNTEAGRGDIPARLTDDQAYAYANLLAAYRRFLREAQEWARVYDSTVVAFLLAPDSDPWNPLKEALNETLALWMLPRLDALRTTDPEALITIGHVDPILASLPANNWLNYRSFHRYPPASRAGIDLTMVLFDDLRAAVRGKPVMLGEFGFSTAFLDETRAAALEAEMVEAVRDHGGAGALKWMLNDFPQGFNPRENNFGMYRGDGSAKPVVAAFQGLGPLQPLARASGERPVDYPMSDGHFFTQTNGREPGADLSGYSVTNADGVPFWEMWQSLGLENVGYPLSRRFRSAGFVTQVFQKAIFQWQPALGVTLVNVFDELGDRRLDAALRARWLIPFPQPTADAGKEWDAIVNERLGWLEEYPEIRDRYLAAPDPLLVYGLPTSRAQDLGTLIAVRTQRTVLQLWKEDVPWAEAGQVTVANGGQIALESGLFSALSPFLPEPPPAVTKDE